MGIFYFNFIYNDVPSKKGHFISSNMFTYNFCLTGCAFAVGGDKIQQFYFSDNDYSFMVASKHGAIFDASRLALKKSDQLSALWT